MRKMLLGFLLILLLVYLFTLLYIDDLKEENVKLSEEISVVRDILEKTVIDNQNYEEEISRIKEDKKDKLEELEIWKEIKEKINQAIS